MRSVILGWATLVLVSFASHAEVIDVVLEGNAQTELMVTDQFANPPSQDTVHTTQSDGTSVEITPVQLLDQQELQELVSPVALYPDDLLALVLPASTYPLQIVAAARYRTADNPGNIEPEEEWDESVVALLNYPEVLELLNEDINWTWQLGQSVLEQQADVLSAVQTFREIAKEKGNLITDEQQVVKVETDSTIIIEPADPEVIYVPYYEPAEVVVYQPRRVYHYYSDPYPVYYYPYAQHHHFYHDHFWGLSSIFALSWTHHYVSHHFHDHYNHRYYHHSYHNRHFYRTKRYHRKLARERRLAHRSKHKYRRDRHRDNLAPRRPYQEQYAKDYGRDRGARGNRVGERQRAQKSNSQRNLQHVRHVNNGSSKASQRKQSKRLKEQRNNRQRTHPRNEENGRIHNSTAQQNKRAERQNRRPAVMCSHTHDCARDWSSHR